jgi:hypothetical protein
MTPWVGALWAVLGAAIYAAGFAHAWHVKPVDRRGSPTRPEKPKGPMVMGG